MPRGLHADRERSGVGQCATTRQRLWVSPDPAATHLLSGRVAREITEFAETVAADWIVVGTHGHTGFKHIVLGSIAEQVVREATCTVVVVRSELPEAATTEAYAAPQRFTLRWDEPLRAHVA